MLCFVHILHFQAEGKKSPTCYAIALKKKKKTMDFAGLESLDREIRSFIQLGKKTGGVNKPSRLHQYSAFPPLISIQK